MAELPYMQFYPGDWLRDTRTLSASAKGAWIDLICAMWDSREPGTLALRLSAFGRLIGLPEDRTAKVLDEIADLGICERENLPDGVIRITCRRVARDRGKLEENKQAMSDGGKKGAQARWEAERRRREESDREANGPPISPPDANPEVRSQNPKREKREAADAAPHSLDFSVKLTEVSNELLRLWPSASKALTKRESSELVDAMPLLTTFSGEDWQACLAWNKATKHQRDGEALWPRNRREFVNNAGEAIERIRNWWKDTGRKLSQPLIHREPSPDPPVMTPEQRKAAMEEWERLKKEKKNPPEAA